MLSFRSSDPVRRTQLDAASTRYCEIPAWPVVPLIKLCPPAFSPNSVSAWLGTLISIYWHTGNLHLRSLTCTHTCSRTHTVSGEGARGAGIALRGSSFLYSSLVITGLGNTGSPGTSTLKEVMAMSPLLTQRITLHRWQVWNCSLLELLQALFEKGVGSRRSYISQLLAVPWRDEWQFEKLHCYSDFLDNRFSVNKVICTKITAVICALTFQQLLCYNAFENKS